MSLQIEPEFYTPIQNKDGIYIDKTPSFYDKPQGIRCPCNTTQQQRCYISSSSFNAHCKSQMHIKWLETINSNKNNLLVENEKLKDTVKQQQSIITDLSNKLETKILYINGLLELCTLSNKKNTQHTSENLIDIDYN